jgi:hypothetical protein
MGKENLSVFGADLQESSKRKSGLLIRKPLVENARFCSPN